MRRSTVKQSSTEVGAHIEVDDAQLRSLESMLADMQNALAPAPDARVQR